jgi:hypothetical protein
MSSERVRVFVAREIIENVGYRVGIDPRLERLNQELNRHSPDSRFVGRDVRFIRAARNQIRLQLPPLAAQIVGLLSPQGCDPSLCVHQGIPLSSSSAPFGPEAPHAGAGGARNREINVRISLNICRDTATSAIWNVT